MSTTRGIEPSGTRSPMSGGSSIGWSCMQGLNLGSGIPISSRSPPIISGLTAKPQVD